MEDATAGERRRDQVRAVSVALRHLHRSLLTASAGPGDDPQRLFQRALGDPELGWLRPVSQLIVGLDELVEQETLTPDGAEGARRRVEEVLGDEGFRARYAALGQAHPEAVVGLAEVKLNLQALPGSSGSG